MESLANLMKEFPDDRSCRIYLMRQKSPNMMCLKCGRPLHYESKYRSFKCSLFHRFTPTKDTIFFRTQLPLIYWFYAIHMNNLYGEKFTYTMLLNSTGIGSSKAVVRMLRLIRTENNPDYLSDKLKKKGISILPTGRYAARYWSRKNSKEQIISRFEHIGVYDTFEEAVKARAKYIESKVAGGRET